MTNTRTAVSFLATEQPEKAQAFYSEVLGLELIETSPFALVFADGAHVLRVQILPELQPAAYTVYGWQTQDILAEMRDLGAKGVAFLQFDHLCQDAQGIWTTPDGHKIAWLKDPSSNVLSLTQYAVTP